jgi:predicted MPP superfamily phosphohydrolase
VTLGRRIAAGLLIALLGAATWGFWLEPSSLTVREVNLPLAWPLPHPLRIAVLSDLHVGSPYYGLSRLPQIVARTNGSRPDLICILGDVLTLGVIGGHYVPPAPIAAELRHLRARYGIFAVLGNHDRLSDGPGLERALEGAGIRVLEDTAVLVRTADGPLWLAGVSDLWTGPHDVGRALGAVRDSTTPLIVLTHNPDLFPELPARVLLTLAGHTHGGQVRLPLIGAPIVPSRFGQRYVAGHVVEHGRHLFVATGLGTSDLPIRLGVPPAIFLLTLAAEREAAPSSEPSRAPAAARVQRSRRGSESR